MDIDAVAEQLGNRLDTITNLRVHKQPGERIVPDAAVIGYPDTITYDITYQRGGDRLAIPLLVVCGRLVDRATRTRLAQYVIGNGPRSIKEVLETGTYTAFNTIVVQAAEFDVVELHAVPHIAALFTIDIAGRGEV